MFYGTQSDYIRAEQEFRKNAKKYRDAGDNSSMTDWAVFRNHPITEPVTDETLYFRKRLNHDGTYEVLYAKKDKNRRNGERVWDSGLYYAKLITINVNEDSPAKHRDILDVPWSGCNYVWEEDMYSSDGSDTGAEYINELLFNAWYHGAEDRFPGLNYKGELATEQKDFFCTDEQLRSFANSLGIDIGFKIPSDVYGHLDPEHTYEF